MAAAQGRLLAAAVAVSFLACAESPPPRPAVQVEDAWVRAVAGPDVNTAAYMTLHNAGGAPDRLTGARSESAQMTELHRTTIDAAGLARMGRAEGLDLPAGGQATLEPGGYHLMLMGVGSLVEGDTVHLTLVLDVSDSVHVAAEVRPY